MLDMPVTPMGIWWNLCVVRQKVKLVADVILQTKPTSAFGNVELFSDRKRWGVDHAIQMAE
jgi:hypothetical protein